MRASRSASPCRRRCVQAHTPPELSPSLSAGDAVRVTGTAGAGIGETGASGSGVTGRSGVGIGTTGTCGSAVTPQSDFASRCHGYRQAPPVRSPAGQAPTGERHQARIRCSSRAHSTPFILFVLLAIVECEGYLNKRIIGNTGSRGSIECWVANPTTSRLDPGSWRVDRLRAHRRGPVRRMSGPETTPRSTRGRTVRGSRWPVSFDPTARGRTAARRHT